MSLAIGSEMIAGNARIVSPNTICNPNLLINSNFKINTSGKDSYTEFNKSCVNNWTVTSSQSPDVSFEINPVEQGLRVRVSGTSDAYINISQKLTRNIEVGTLFSISCKTVGYEATWDAFIRDATNNSYFYQEQVTQIGPRIVYNTITNEFIIRVYSGEDIILQYVKIEHGENGTMYVGFPR